MEKDDLIAGDRTQAEALRIAEDWLKRQGWKFTPADVGKRAKEVIDALATRRRNEMATLIKRPGEFAHLMEVCEARNALGASTVRADGFKSGQRVNQVSIDDDKLRNLLWRHRDDICALIYRANPDR